MSKLYLKINPAPRLYLSLPDVHNTPKLFLNIEKANPFRDPSVGTFIGGGAIKANTEDLSDKMEELLNDLPGEDD